MISLVLGYYREFFHRIAPTGHYREFLRKFTEFLPWEFYVLYFTFSVELCMSIYAANGSPQQNPTLFSNQRL